LGRLKKLAQRQQQQQQYWLDRVESVLLLLRGGGKSQRHMVNRLNSGDGRPVDYCVGYRDEFEYMQFCSAAINTGTTITGQSAEVYICCSGI